MKLTNKCIVIGNDMDFDKLNLIKADVLKVPLNHKPWSDDCAGVYVEGGDRPFLFEEHDAPFQSFVNFSKYHYPIYLFVNRNHTEELQKLLNKYQNVRVFLIDELSSCWHYNWFMINKVFDAIDPKHENLITFQSDGFLIKSGWEDFCLQYDYLGAKWKEPIRLLENSFKLPAITVGNGGFSFRKLSKLMEVKKLVQEAGGQKIIKGMFIDEVLRLQTHLINEDIFFCYFGFGLNVFKTVTEEEVNKFSVEPITLDCYNSREVPYGFHKIDE